jgi:hypothetical protein
MWTDKLRILDACDVAISWASQYPTAQQAWEACKRPDWMIWLAGQTGVSDRVLWRAAVRMARLVEHLMTDERSRHALDMQEAWLDGHATDDEMAAARAAAWAAAREAAEAATRYAAEAATRAAAGIATDVAWYAAEATRAVWAAEAAAGATRAAWDAGWTARAAARAAGCVLHHQCANIVRELIPIVPL